MKNSFQYIVLVALVFMMSSCGEDFFSTTLDIDPPEHTPQVATHAFLNYDTQEIEVLVSETLSITKVDARIGERDDATVNLIADATTELIIPLTDNFIGFNYKESAILQANDEYTLRVSLPGFEEASSTQKIPTKVTVSDIQFFEDGGIDNDGEDRSAIDIVINDPAGEENFYEIFVLVDSDPDPNKEFFYSTYADSNDPIVSRGYNYDGVLLSDASFDGTAKNLRIQMYPTDQQEVDEKIWLKVKSVSKDYFQFTKTLERFNELDGNPFATPIQIFTNFDKGVGIFSVHREELIKI